MNKICLGYFQHNSKFLKWLLFFFQYPHRKVLLFPIQIHLLLKLTALLQKDCAEDNLTDLFTSMWSNLPHNYLTLPDRCQNLFFHYCYWSHWANLLCVSIQNEPNTLSNIFTHVIFFFFFFLFLICAAPSMFKPWMNSAFIWQSAGSQAGLSGPSGTLAAWRESRTSLLETLRASTEKHGSRGGRTRNKNIAQIRS